MLHVLLGLFTSTGSIVDHDGDHRVTIYCVGDSNTMEGEEHLSWCGQLRVLLPEVSAIAPDGHIQDVPVVTHAIAFGGATAVGPLPHRRYGHLAQVWPLVVSGNPDVVIVAFGTNDLLVDATDDDIVAALKMAEADATSRHIAFYAALVPPIMHPASHDPIRQAVRVAPLNERLRREFQGHIVDFWTGFDVNGSWKPYYGNYLHLNEAGQRLRAVRAAHALAPDRF